MTGVQTCALPIFCVYTKEQQEQVMAANEDDSTGTLLTDSELKDEPGAQELVGQSRVGSLIKELMKDKTSKFEIAGKEKADPTSLDTLPLGTKSPVGSSQNKIPSPVKGK